MQQVDELLFFMEYSTEDIIIKANVGTFVKSTVIVIATLLPA